MKIGILVKQSLHHIFTYCETRDHHEFERLLDRDYSKRQFGIHFPFCIDVTLLSPNENKRYWTEVYFIRGKQVRVTSQWFETSRQSFLSYLHMKGINAPHDMPVSSLSLPSSVPSRLSPSSRANSRYKGNPIGNAQNAFIRTILSSLGQEAFTEKDWQETKAYFAYRCAYCEGEGEMVMEHAIPINKEHLGEHRLGNLVPSCQRCNMLKANQTFRTFLHDNPSAIARIEGYMERHNYVPLNDNTQMKRFLTMAHKEVAALADRYITILNTLFSQSEEENPPHL